MLGPVGSEVLNNPGGSVINSAEVIAVDLLKAISYLLHSCGSSTGGRIGWEVGGDVRVSGLLEL
jgi:hypothetical protein